MLVQWSQELTIYEEEQEVTVLVQWSQELTIYEEEGTQEVTVLLQWSQELTIYEEEDTGGHSACTMVTRAYNL
ncbi:hypothetical protein GDO81_018758 [Engystomops pustulosus]|uniref:Uncharacterized protein n=1 Tax=Engystomops pustulosus TaxID=76066 RepID=A0AAV6YEY6_ENGPU|nr:hypothetical protein GDO81_018758 [Engystomops pustulosus]